MTTMTRIAFIQAVRTKRTALEEQLLGDGSLSEKPADELNTWLEKHTQSVTFDWHPVQSKIIDALSKNIRTGQPISRIHLLVAMLIGHLSADKDWGVDEQYVLHWLRNNPLNLINQWSQNVAHISGPVDARTWHQTQQLVTVLPSQTRLQKKVKHYIQDQDVPSDLDITDLRKMIDFFGDKTVSRSDKLLKIIHSNMQRHDKNFADHCQALLDDLSGQGKFLSTDMVRKVKQHYIDLLFHNSTLSRGQKKQLRIIESSLKTTLSVQALRLMVANLMTPLSAKDDWHRHEELLLGIAMPLPRARAKIIKRWLNQINDPIMEKHIRQLRFLMAYCPAMTQDAKYAQAYLRQVDLVDGIDKNAISTWVKYLFFDQPPPAQKLRSIRQQMTGKILDDSFTLPLDQPWDQVEISNAAKSLDYVQNLLEFEGPLGKQMAINLKMLFEQMVLPKTQSITESLVGVYNVRKQALGYLKTVTQYSHAKTVAQAIALYQSCNPSTVRVNVLSPHSRFSRRFYKNHGPGLLLATLSDLTRVRLALKDHKAVDGSQEQKIAKAYLKTVSVFSNQDTVRHATEVLLGTQPLIAHRIHPQSNFYKALNKAGLLDQCLQKRSTTGVTKLGLLEQARCITQTPGPHFHASFLESQAFKFLKVATDKDSTKALGTALRILDESIDNVQAAGIFDLSDGDRLKRMALSNGDTAKRLKHLSKGKPSVDHHSDL